MKTIAYIRVSTIDQDIDKQKLEIYNYAQKHKITVDEFISIKVSSRKNTAERKIDELMSILEEGDCLIVSELSRIGRSLGQIVKIVEELTLKGIRLIAIKENIVLDGKKQSMQNKVMIGMFGLFSEIERDLISDRTKQALASVKAKGIKIGRPKGSLGKSKLDGKEDEIKHLLSKEVSKAAIGRLLGVSRTTVRSFIKTRNISVEKEY